MSSSDFMNGCELLKIFDGRFQRRLRETLVRFKFILNKLNTECCLSVARGKFTTPKSRPQQRLQLLSGHEEWHVTQQID